MTPAPSLTRAPGSAASKRWWLWLPLLGASGWLALFGDKTPEASQTLAQPVRPGAAAALTPGSATAGSAMPGSAGRPAPVGPSTTPTSAPPPQDMLALLPREALVRAPADAAGATAAHTAPRDPFGARSWNPPPPPPPPAAPPAPPMAPPLPYAFLGKKFEDGAWEVYLGRSEQSFVVRPGTVLEGLYRVDRIEPPQMALTYLPLGQVQTLSIGETR